MNAPLAIKSFSALSAALLLASVAHAETYITEFSTGTSVEVTIDDLGNTFTVNHVEVVWSTSVAAGNPVAVADLSDLSFSLYSDSDVLVYMDNAIMGGAVQPLGGVSRTLADIVFNATSGTTGTGSNGTVQSLDNDLNQVQFGSASGSTFNIYGVTSGGAPAINLAAYFNGQFKDDATFTVSGQTTGAIPEPSSCAALAGLLGLGFAAARRKRA